MKLTWRAAVTTARRAVSRTGRADPPVAETLLEQHKDELPPRITVP